MFSCEVRDLWLHPCLENWLAIGCAVVYYGQVSMNLMQELNAGTVLPVAHFKPPPHAFVTVLPTLSCNYKGTEQNIKKL